jgi:kynurenine formamidase
MVDRVSNWGRWGPGDELGTVNLIDRDSVRRGSEAVRSGEAFSLALPVSPDFPQAPGSSRPNARHKMIGLGETYSDDAVEMALHGSTHWDALSHIFDKGRMYNDRPAAEHVGEGGAAHNAITAVAGRLLTRAVLVDVARFLGVEALAETYEVTSADLEGCLEAQGSEVAPGDALLVRTGHLGRIRREGGWKRFTDGSGRNPLEPGLGLACLPWIHERGIAAVAADNWAVEVIGSTEMVDLPLHTVGIVHMGLTLGEIFDLDPLAAACAEDGRYEVLLAAPPLPIVGAVGGPVHPLAVR